MFIAALFIIEKGGYILHAHQQIINKMWYSYAEKYYLAIKQQGLESKRHPV